MIQLELFEITLDDIRQIQNHWKKDPNLGMGSYDLKKDSTKTVFDMVMKHNDEL